MAKVDANSILKNGGNDALNSEFDRIDAESEEEFEKIEKQIEEEQAQKAKQQNEKAAKDKANKYKKLVNQIFYLPISDYDNASRIIIFKGKYFRYNFDTDTWGIFENGVWKFTTSKNSALRPFFEELVELIDKNRERPPKMIHKPDGSIENAEPDKVVDLQKIAFGEKLISNIKKTKNQNAAIEQAKGRKEIVIRQSDLDKNPMLLNVKNGVLDLETGRLYDAAPELLLTKQCNAVFNPRANCPVFNQFMQEIIPDDQTRAAVLRFLGYCLTGKVNEEKALFVIGEGGNGKGTLFETIHYLLNDYATTFDVEVILRQRFSKNANAASPEIAKLCGVRFAYAPEIPAGREFDLATFKSLSGGDKITARPMYQSPIIFDPSFKMLLSGQHFIKVENAHDVGFFRRFVPVIFDQTFTGEKANIHLKEELRLADELSGILNLLLDECLKWQNSGLIMSDAMQKTREEYIENNDFVANFIDDNCEFGENQSVTRKDFLAALKREYPQARRFLDKQLIDMVQKNKDIIYNPRAGQKCTAVFFGISLKDKTTQGNLNFE